MRSTMSNLDAALDSLERRDTVIALTPDSMAAVAVAADTTAPHRHLTLWLDAGVPVKLVSTEPGPFGEGLLDTQYWFLSGELALVYGPDDACAIDAGRIVLWTDAALIPFTDFSATDRSQRENDLADRTKHWLAVFGVALP